MRALLALLFAIAVQAQERPEFQASGVERTGSRDIYSIYGGYLGPVKPCVSDAANPPLANCGVVVLFDEHPVPLMYVQAGQINFLAPHRDPVPDRISLRVVYRGVSSIPVAVQFGADRVGIEPAGDAYTGLPVWVRVVDLSRPDRIIQLPVALSVLRFPDCPRIEVQFQGHILQQRRTLNPPQRLAFSGPPCRAPLPPHDPSLAGRVPLHLFYTFDRPGIYLVRYVSGERPTLNTSDSAWTPIEVRPGTPARRAKWLRDLAASAPTDPESLIYDFLPSIFGYGDDATLEIAKKYLHHPDPAVAARTAAYLSDYYPAPTIKDLVR